MGSDDAHSDAMLVALPDGYKPEQVAPALAEKIKTLPDSLRRLLTWDQGPEMRDWKQLRVDAGIEVFFCDPHSPWQRGTNENTNGLLRQYFPKGTDFSAVTEAELDRVADELNDRPRKRLGSTSPANASPSSAGCAAAARGEATQCTLSVLRWDGACLREECRPMARDGQRNGHG